jgi:hypothetical protein
MGGPQRDQAVPDKNGWRIAFGLRRARGGQGPPARLRAPPEAHSGGSPIDLNALVLANVGIVVTGLSVVLLVTILALLWTARRARRLDRRLASLTRGSDGATLEAVLQNHLDRLFRVSEELDELSARGAVLEATGRRALQRVGLVRYNPFEDTGGNQSFALALLDAEDDGVVISSLHARSGTRVYAKAVFSGRSDGALSAEEAEALRLARTATRGKPVTAERGSPQRVASR